MATRTAPQAPEKLEWSDDDEANRLIAGDPLALLIGFVLDQQITVEKAFLGPKLLRERVGTLDPGTLARLDGAQLARAFTGPPAIHRFPSAMAERVQALCAIVDERYQGDAARIWSGVGQAEELRARLLELPGFGAAKVAITQAVLAQHFGVRPTGWRKLLPDFPTLAGVTTRAERVAYQTGKREHKRRLREEAAR
ncbi:MAG: HhH-GPD-type base excision DNA repair protein [Candidatus Dormibacteria bacterium]